MACGDNIQKDNNCGEHRIENILNYDGLKYILSKLSNKLVVALGVLRTKATKPLHLERVDNESTVTISGYVDTATTDEVGVVKVKEGNGLHLNDGTASGEEDNNGQIYMSTATTKEAGALSVEDKIRLDELYEGFYGDNYINNIEASGTTPLTLEATKVGTKVIIKGNVSEATQEEAGLLSAEDKKKLDESKEVLIWTIKSSIDIIYFETTNCSTTVAFKLYKGDEVQKISSYDVSYYLEGSLRQNTLYREISLSDDNETLNIVVKRNTVAQRSGYLTVELIDDSSHSETITLPVMSTSNSFLLAQGRISFYDILNQDSLGHHLDVETTYANELFHYYKTFDGSAINVRWLTRGRCFLELPKDWENYFGTFNVENIQMHAELAGVGGNEFGRFLVFSIHSAGDYMSAGTVSEDCWGAVSIYGEIEKDETLYGSDVHTATTQDSPIKYSIWYNSLAGSWKSTSLREREDGSKLENGIRASLSYSVSTTGTLWADSGEYEPTLQVKLLYVDPDTNQVTNEVVSPTSVSYEVINAPEGKVSVDENTGVVEIDASGTGTVVQFSIQANITYRHRIVKEGAVGWETYTTTATSSGYINS